MVWRLRINIMLIVGLIRDMGTGKLGESFLTGGSMLVNTDLLVKYD